MKKIFFQWIKYSQWLRQEQECQSAPEGMSLIMKCRAMLKKMKGQFNTRTATTEPSGFKQFRKLYWNLS